MFSLGPPGYNEKVNYGMRLRTRTGETYRESN